MEINTDKIKKCATDFSSNIDDMNDEYKKIVEALEKLKGRWKGDRAMVFYKVMYSDYLPKLSKAINDLGEYSSYISGVPQVYASLDNSYANKKIDV